MLNAAAREIGDLYRARIAIAADSAVPRLDDLRRARRNAISLVEQLRFIARLAELPEAVMNDAFREWDTASDAAGREARTARPPAT